MVCLDIPDNVQEEISNYSEDVEQQRDECVYYILDKYLPLLYDWMGLSWRETAMLGTKAALRSSCK